MIFELVSLASNFVTEHHSIVRDVQHTSLIEERLVRSTEAREKQQRDDEAETLRQEALQRSEDLELTRQVSEHLEKKAELVRREKQKAAAMAPSIGTSGALGSSEKSLPIPTSFTFQVGAKSLYVTRSLAVPGVHVGQVFTGQVGGLEAARLQIIDIKGRYYESQQGKRKLSKVQEDIERASKLRQANVHQILALGFTDLRLVVVSEAAPAATLKDVLDQCGNFRADKAVAYTLQLLKALAAVHEAHLVHRGPFFPLSRVALCLTPVTQLSSPAMSFCIPLRVKFRNRVSSWRIRPGSNDLATSTIRTPLRRFPARTPFQMPGALSPTDAES